jgi:hypothetical protein
MDGTNQSPDQDDPDEQDALAMGIIGDLHSMSIGASQAQRSIELLAAAMKSLGPDAKMALLNRDVLALVERIRNACSSMQDSMGELAGEIVCSKRRPPPGSHRWN